MWKNKGPWITKASWNSKNKAWGITILNFKMFYKNSCNQHSLVLAQKQTQRSMEQNKNTGNETTHLSQLIFDKQAEINPGRKYNFVKK